MKNFIKNILVGLITSFVVFIFVSLYISFIYKDSTIFFSSNFIKSFIASIVIALGFSIPAIIYQNDNISMFFKVLIHLTIGMIVYIITAFYVGWFSPQTKLSFTIFMILLALFIFFILWFCFYKYEQNLAKKINQKIKNIEKERDNNIPN